MAFTLHVSADGFSLSRLVLRTVTSVTNPGIVPGVKTARIDAFLRELAQTPCSRSPHGVERSLFRSCATRASARSTTSALPAMAVTGLAGEPGLDGGASYQLSANREGQPRLTTDADGLSTQVNDGITLVEWP